MTDETKRRRGISLGETIALAALIVSAFGVWIAWRSSNDDRTTRVVEQKQAIPLSLRGRADRDGSTLTITPVEPGHALQSLTVAVGRASPIDVGSDGELRASDVENALKDRLKEPKDVTRRLPVRIDARYVELGKDRRGGGTYTLRYKWDGGGLFGGRALRLLGLGR